MEIDPAAIGYSLLRTALIISVLIGLLLRNFRGAEERVFVSAIISGSLELILSGFLNEWLHSEMGFFHLLIVYSGFVLLIGLPVSIAVYFVWERIMGNRVD